jgi:O-antigen/teichoic acid export membrane protein
MQWPSISVLYATAKHRFYARLSLSEAAANVALSVILVQFYGIIGVSLGTAIPLLISMLVVQPKYVCRVLRLDLATYYREIGRAAFYAMLSQMALFLIVRVSGIASVAGILALCFAYYPPCWALLVRSLLPQSDRRRLHTVVPALKWLWI